MILYKNNRVLNYSHPAQRLMGRYQLFGHNNTQAKFDSYMATNVIAHMRISDYQIGEVDPICTE